MSDTTEPATMKDLVERFRKFSFRSETYPINGDGDFVYQFDAAEIAKQQVIEPFNFAEKVPFCLEWNKLSLFPEFYSSFKRSFSNQTHVNDAYCRLSPDEFRSLFTGTKKDVSASINRIERNFATQFQRCLSAELQKELPMTYTRENVETKFVERIDDDADHRSVGARFFELLLGAQKGEVTSFVEHLMAFEFSEGQIWWAVSAAFGGFAKTDTQIRTFNRKMSYWKSYKNASLVSRVKDFVSDLKDASIVEVTSASKPNGKKRKRNASNLKGSGGDTDEDTHPTQTRAKRQRFSRKERQEYKKRMQQKAESKETQKKNANTSGKVDKRDVSRKGRGSLQRVDTPPTMNLPVDLYSRVRFKWNGGAAIHVVRDKSLLSNFDPDATCISEPAFVGDVYLQGAGEMKIRLKDGTVVFLKEVFYSDQLRENILSPVAYNSFFTGVVGNKLIRLDTGAEIGYLQNGTPQVDVEVLDFDNPIDENSLTNQPKLPAMMLGRLCEPTQSLSAEERVTPEVSQEVDPVSRPFEILRADLSGPFNRPIGWDNSLYFLTVVDRFSRLLHVSPIRYENAGTNELLKYIRETYTHPFRKVIHDN